VTIQRAPGVVPIALLPIVRLARRKCSRLCAAFHTDCTTEERRVCASLRTDCATEVLRIARDIAHTLHGGSAQVVRGIANGLRDGRAADRARQCAQTARRKSSRLCAALHTDCTTEEQRIVRGSARRKRPFISR
jgi:hypothetical protein